MDAEAKGLTVEDLTLGQAPSPEALVARFVGEGILHLAEDGTLWRLKRKVGGHRGPRYQSELVQCANVGRNAEYPHCGGPRTWLTRMRWSDGPVVELWSRDDCRRSFLREETHS